MTDHTVHVVHVLGSLEAAGLQGRVLTLIRALPTYRHTVVCNAVTRGAMYDEFASHSQVIPVTFQRGSLLSGMRYLPRLTATLRRCQPDVVFAYLFGNHALVSIAARAARVRTTYAVSANDPVHYAGSRWQPFLLAQIARPFCRGEIAVSEAVGAVLRNTLLLPASRVRVIANGLAVEETAARADAGRRSRNTAEDRPRLVMVAWISRAKDHGTVIRAVAHLREKGREVQVSFAGGTYRKAPLAELQQLTNTLGVADLVSFLGVRNDVPELMGGSDVVILATHSEGFGIVLLEAFASRTPVIATDVPACREVLDHGRCGVLVPPRDHVALAAAIESLLSDRDRQRELVESGFKRVQDDFHARRMAAGYAELIEAAVAR